MAPLNKSLYQLLMICTAMVFMGFTLSAGGPWPQKKGKGYYKLSQWWINFDQHYTDQGLIDPNVTTGIYNTSFYGEYGITDRLTAIVFAPLFSRNVMNNLVSNTTGEIVVPGDALNSVGDSDISFKYGLTRSGASIPVSVSLTLGLPIGKVGGGVQKNLQTGDGEFNQLVQVDIGKGLNLSESFQTYVSGSTGFNNRTNGFSDEWRWGLELGVGLLDQKLWVIGRLVGVESLKNGSLSDEINSTSIFANNSEFTSYGVEVAYYITSTLGISANVTSAFRGEIIAASPSYSLGVFLDLSK